ncbi:hypothetical protein [Streptomyces sp. NPDC005385]|uniref:hypothetical protein n=1 Tax=Streptomyces sp. NPDC005385 TaxID=3157039 RepID=UPI0033ABEF2F
MGDRFDDLVSNSYPLVVRDLSEPSPYGLAEVPSDHMRRGLFADIGVDGLPASRAQRFHLGLHALGDELLVHTRNRLRQIPRLRHAAPSDHWCGYDQL